VAPLKLLKPSEGCFHTRYPLRGCVELKTLGFLRRISSQPDMPQSSFARLRSFVAPVPDIRVV
jgi:hypothetical protein